MATKMLIRVEKESTTKPWRQRQANIRWALKRMGWYIDDHYDWQMLLFGFGAILVAFIFATLLEIPGVAQ